MKTHITPTVAVVIVGAVLASFLDGEGDVATVGSRDARSDNFVPSPYANQHTVSRAVVRVINETEGTLGSGALVAREGPGEYLILTAQHCVDRPGNDLLVEYSLFGPRNRTSTVTILATDGGRDLALLRAIIFEDLPTIRIAAAQEIPTATPVEVTVAGFPSGRLEISTASAHKQSFRGRQHWRFDRDFGHGISGGPVIAQVSPMDFAIIGTVWGAAQFSEWNAMASAEVAEFIADTGEHAYVLDGHIGTHPVSVGDGSGGDPRPSRSPRPAVHPEPQDLHRPHIVFEDELVVDGFALPHQFIRIHPRRCPPHVLEGLARVRIPAPDVRPAGDDNANATGSSRSIRPQ